MGLAQDVGLDVVALVVAGRFRCAVGRSIQEPVGLDVVAGAFANALALVAPASCSSAT